MTSKHDAQQAPEGKPQDAKADQDLENADGTDGGEAAGGINLSEADAAMLEDVLTEAESEADDVEDKLLEAEQEIAQLKDRLLRAMAETENVRRRAERDKEDARRYSITNFARELLSVSDNLRRALDNVPESMRAKDSEAAGFVSGIELTERELLNAFEKCKISRIKAIGEKLDPNRHQAMMQVDDPSAPANTIVQEVQTGYMIEDRLLRPAMVGVSSGKGYQASPAGQQAADDAPAADAKDAANDDKPAA